jgi:hypothetical protein
VEDGFAPDDLAPAVDRHYLRLYVRGELAPDTVRLVEDLVAMFRPWRTALDEVVLEEQGEPPALTGPPPP